MVKLDRVAVLLILVVFDVGLMGYSEWMHCWLCWCHYCFETVRFDCVPHSGCFEFVVVFAVVSCCLYCLLSVFEFHWLVQCEAHSWMVPMGLLLHLTLVWQVLSLLG